MNKYSSVTCKICGRTYGLKAGQDPRPEDLDGSSSTAAYLTGWTRDKDRSWTCNISTCQDPFRLVKLELGLTND